MWCIFNPSTNKTLYYHSPIMGYDVININAIKSSAILIQNHFFVILLSFFKLQHAGMWMKLNSNLSIVIKDAHKTLSDTVQAELIRLAAFGIIDVADNWNQEPVLWYFLFSFATVKVENICVLPPSLHCNMHRIL